MKRAKDYNEIKPLVEFCKAGKLFDVQVWISEGKPVNPPIPESTRKRKKSPLQVAMEAGFHSLVQVLLEGGAAQKDALYSPLSHALSKRRLDLVELLVDHGADIHQVSMDDVFDTWDNEIVEYFIKKGADLETDDPLAYALCSRIRPALGILKRHEARFPSFHEQVNIAFRYHCKEGNLKWVSLTLWAGADPYARGPDIPGDKPDPDEDCRGLELAALYGHYEIFKLKNIHLDPDHKYASDLLRNVCHNNKADLLQMFLDKGYDPKNLEDHGSSLIESLLLSMGWDYDVFLSYRNNKNIDTSCSREKMKMLHMLVRKGAKWKPEGKDNISWIRRSLLKMKSDYIMEFVWIMSEYKACTRCDIEELMRTPSIRSLITSNMNRYHEMMEAFIA